MDNNEKVLKKAREHRADTLAFLKKLKRIKPQALDQAFQQAHDEVFAQTDCLACANCCKTTSPIFRDVDIDRLAKALRIKPSAFTERYLHLDEDGHWVLQQSPCAFLLPDNRCSVYDHRPGACREYPHTNRKKMHQLLTLTARNAEVCPAVWHIVEKLNEIGS
jgi:Fe-S-cluster containining protein